ncbi:hypothetical protein IAQ61_001429 [Plenodomus lingam]|uniref:uncharacterized protein n=1 Tax=Leptosphaeria maculans TaxID=5022 RepID=UPI0033201DC5|nr:hypothetical protein IAQ61_001429 [Plenodomus lingam]
MSSPRDQETYIRQSAIDISVEMLVSALIALRNGYAPAAQSTSSTLIKDTCTVYSTSLDSPLRRGKSRFLNQCLTKRGYFFCLGGKYPNGQTLGIISMD